MSLIKSGLESSGLSKTTCNDLSGRLSCLCQLSIATLSALCQAISALCFEFCVYHKSGNFRVIKFSCVKFSC